MKMFEIGVIYSTRSALDHDCKIEYEVISRTAATITLKAVDTAGAAHRVIYGDEVIKCRVIKKLSEYRGAESVKPWGSYSMAPTLSADQVRRPEI
jgi:hypothetical protein